MNNTNSNNSICNMFRICSNINKTIIYTLRSLEVMDMQVILRALLSLNTERPCHHLLTRIRTDQLKEDLTLKVEIQGEFQMIVAFQWQYRYRIANSNSQMEAASCLEDQEKTLRCPRYLEEIALIQKCSKNLVSLILLVLIRNSKMMEPLL